jgi:hypothetical protein
VNRHYIFADIGRDSVSLFLRDLNGKRLYWFGCHNTDFSGTSRDPFHDDENDYYGFDCHLHDLKDENGYNLLSYSPDHKEDFSRALTVWEELQGRCADYPDWGRKREIRLRGMRIILEFKDFRLSKHPNRVGTKKMYGEDVQSFRLDVRISPDSSASFEIAGPPAFVMPLQELPNSRGNISDNCSKAVPSSGNSTR